MTKAAGCFDINNLILRVKMPIKYFIQFWSKQYPERAIAVTCYRFQFCFHYANFATISLKIAKYINTVQIPAIGDVDCRFPATLFLSYQKQVAMLPQNLTLHQSPVGIIQQPLTLKKNSMPKKSESDEKSCKHRNKNGWCSKSRRQCLLLTELFSKH